jgi:hypothetical protein
MPYLQAISRSGERLTLEWRNGDEVTSELVTMKSEFAALEAEVLRSAIRPNFRSEALAWRIMKTVRTSPRR